jgi:hypothetical protein
MNCLRRWDSPPNNAKELAGPCMLKTQCQRLNSWEDFVTWLGLSIQKEWLKVRGLRAKNIGLANAY